MQSTTHRVLAVGLLGILIAACGQPAVSPTAAPPASTATTAAAVPPTSAPTQAPSLSPEPAGNADVIKIVSSMPRTGPEETQKSVNAIKLRLEEANYQACDGKFAIVYEDWDDTSPETGAWDAKIEGQNAQKAINDPDVMMYIGPMNSGAAKSSIPILNRANIVMISPSATLPGLTRPNTGGPGEPDVYYPTGKRNFARVVPSDDIQGAVGAFWAKDLGASSVYVLDDGDSYSKTIASIFETKAKGLKLKIVGSKGYNSQTADYKALAAEIIATDPDLVYLVGLVANQIDVVIRELREAGYTGDIMGPDSMYGEDIINSLGPLAEGIYTTFGGVPGERLTGNGKEWYEAYKKAYNEEPGGYTAFNYEAVSAALAGFEQVCTKDRAAVLDAVMGLKDFEGILGTWGFDENGDTTLSTMSGLQIKDGKFEMVTLLSAQE